MAQPAAAATCRTSRAGCGVRVLYPEYMRLHDLFGRGGDDVMKTLKRIRDEMKDLAATTPRERR